MPSSRERAQRGEVAVGEQAQPCGRLGLHDAGEGAQQQVDPLVRGEISGEGDHIARCARGLAVKVLGLDAVRDDAHPPGRNSQPLEVRAQLV